MWRTSACNRCWMSSSSSSGRSAKVRKCCSHVEVPTCTLRWWQWPSLRTCEDLWTSAHVDIEIMTSWTPVTICEGLWTSLNIFEHLWTSVTIFDHLWPSVNIFEHLCTSVNNCEHEWSSVNICDHLWTCVNIFEHLWKHKWISVKISEQLWRYVNICSDICEQLWTSEDILTYVPLQLANGFEVRCKKRICSLRASDTFAFLQNRRRWSGS